jgi:hypothetical protein
MPEIKKPEEKAKREEFRRYLDQSGIVDQMTQFLVNLYEEQEKPSDAVGYMKKALASGPDAADVESLKVEIAELESKLAEMTSRAESAEEKLKNIEAKAETDQTEKETEETE